MTATFENSRVLTVEHLSVAFRTGKRTAAPVPVVRDVSFSVGKGEIVAIVGESGCGKSTTGLALLGLNPDGNALVEGSISLATKAGKSVDVVKLHERDLQRVRGNDAAMIFQEPMSSLNPLYTIGAQIEEALAVHRKMSSKERTDEALRLVSMLGIPSPAKCLKSYPHQLSGGMRQRVMIAIALSCHPALLIADEPTTALDVTVQAQIVERMKKLQEETQMAILFVTHDLSLVAEIADRALVMYAGQIVEAGPIAELFNRPLMPYTQALMRSRPRLGDSRHRIKPIPGGAPNPAALPTGCAFHKRCEHAVKGRCDRQVPTLETTDDGLHQVRCLRWRELQETTQCSPVLQGQTT
ncbi:ABC transporter ATP-binding protein [Caballeronia sp. LZ008]|uniref:ABC transporter ATP-binding protein n=1 Tax=unclassified Caballeronia TaxID=2646786 RepID=UPI002027F865|nr:MULTISPECIES: ABC transporter ATP-binding protein [unclassified Caballeronia]MDR5798157.1 ABC transporter ATP-binding protein [Caballeronia sp. LZ008]